MQEFAALGCQGMSLHHSITQCVMQPLSALSVAILSTICSSTMQLPKSSAILRLPFSVPFTDLLRPLETNAPTLVVPPGAPGNRPETGREFSSRTQRFSGSMWVYGCIPCYTHMAPYGVVGLSVDPETALPFQEQLINHLGQDKHSDVPSPRKSRTKNPTFFHHSSMFSDVFHLARQSPGLSTFLPARRGLWQKLWLQRLGQRPLAVTRLRR